jgi:cytochrome c biogenesis protein CcmG, thiol:disulfide interchange protein DsbE
MRTARALLPLILLAACLPDDHTGPVAVGHTAPAYAAEDLDGRARALDDLRGRPVLLNVWATWCAPCRVEMPALQELHETYGPRGLEVVGVSIDGRGEREGIRSFLREVGATFTIWWDPDATIQTRFGYIGVPTTYLIDGAGTVTWTHLGPVTADDPRLLAALEQALAGG